MSESAEASIAVGLDVSTDPKKTWWAEIVWDAENGARPRLTNLRGGLGPALIVAQLTSRPYSTAAVDVPFGWPTDFYRLLGLHTHGPLPRDFLAENGLSLRPDWYTDDDQHRWRRGSAAHRLTDRFLAHELGKLGRKRTPLSASFDRLGSTTAMWSLIEAHLHHVHSWTVDRAGYRDPQSRRSVIETYPAAQLALWGVESRRKPTWDEFSNLIGGLDLGNSEAALAASDDARDAVICALVAAAFVRKVGLMSPDDVAVREWRGTQPEGDIAREGWIWLTVTSIGQLVSEPSSSADLTGRADERR